MTILQASEIVDTTINNTAYVLMVGMTISPPAGDYLCVFSTSAQVDTVPFFIRCAIFVGGTIIAHTEREQLQEDSYDTKPSDYPLATSASITVTAGQAVEIRWLTTGGLATARKRTMNLFPVVATDVSQVTATADTTLNSATYTLLAGMTLTPGAGDYVLLFSTSADGVSGSELAFAVFVNGVIVQHTERTNDQEASAPTTEYVTFIAAKISPGAAQVVEIRWKNGGTAGIITAHERTLTLYKTDVSNIFEATATADFVATNTVDALLDSMTLTPGASDYLALFSYSIFYGTIGPANEQTFISLYVNAVQISHTERKPVQEESLDSVDTPSMTNGIVSPGAGQIVDIRWRGISAASRTAHERTLVLLKEAAVTAELAWHVPWIQDELG